MQEVEFNGVVYEFPDDASNDEIYAYLDDIDSKSGGQGFTSDRVNDLIKQGLNDTTVGLAINIATGEAPLETSGAEPKGVAENVIKYGTELVAELPSFALTGGAASIATKAGAKLAGKQLTKQLAKKGITKVLPDVLGTAGKQLIKGSAERAVRGGLTFGTQSYIKNTLENKVNTGEYKPIESFQHAVEDALIGGAFDVVLGGIPDVIKVWESWKFKDLTKLDINVATDALKKVQDTTKGYYEAVKVADDLAMADSAVNESTKKIQELYRKYNSQSDFYKEGTLLRSRQNPFDDIGFIKRNEKLIKKHNSLVKERYNLMSKKSELPPLEEATQFIEAGAENAQNIEKALFQKEMSQAGVDVAGVKKHIPWMRKLAMRNMTEEMDLVGMELGLPKIGQFPTKVYESVAKGNNTALGFKKRYLETLKDIDANKLRDVIRKGHDEYGATVRELAGEGGFKSLSPERAKEVAFVARENGMKAMTEGLSPQELKAVGDWRKIADDMYKFQKASGSNVDYREFWFPEQKDLVLSDLQNGRIGSMKQYERAVKELEKKIGSEQKRVPGAENRPELEPTEALDRHLRQLALTDASKNIVPEINKHYVMMKYLGADDYAEAFRSHFSRGLGLDKKVIIGGVEKTAFDAIVANNLANNAAVEADYVVNSALEQIQNIAPDMGKEVYQSIMDSMYKSLVFTNPYTIAVKQPLQNLLVGQAEIGLPYVRRGWKLAKQYLKGEGKLLEVGERNYGRLRNPTQDYTDIQAAKQLSSDKSLLKRAADFPGSFGEKIFDKLDWERNRLGAFFGGYTKFMEQGIKDGAINGKVIETFLESQKDMVREAFIKGGKQEAAEVFGRLMSHRINYMYSYFDKPLMLQEGFLQHIPFTTWGRNQWNRYLSDINKNDSKTIAKRLAYPVAWATGLKFLTGFDMYDAHPAFSTPVPFTGEFLPPFISGTAEDLAQIGRRGVVGTGVSILDKAAQTASLYNAGRKLVKGKYVPSISGKFETTKLPTLPGIIGGAF